MRLVDVGGGGRATTILKKPPVLPKAPVRYTPAPAPSSYYTKTKTIQAAAAKAAPKIISPTPAPKGWAGLEPSKYTTPAPKGWAGLEPSKYTNPKPVVKPTTTTSKPSGGGGSSSGGGGGSYSGGGGSSSGGGGGNTVTTPAYDPMKDPNYLASAAKLNDLWTQASGYKGQIDDLMKTGFTYDPNTDASYKSLQTLAQKNAKVASVGAMETMNDRGILNSTVTGDRLGQIEQTAQDAVTAQVPTLKNAAYGQYMDKLNTLNGLWSSTVNQAQQERAFGESTKEWNLGYQLDVNKFNTANNQWKQQFDWSKTQDSINNGFKGSQLEIDRYNSTLNGLNYDLKSLSAIQSASGVNNKAATQAAISELLQYKNGADALKALQGKASSYYQGGVNFDELTTTINRVWPGFKDTAGSSSTSFK